MVGERDARKEEGDAEEAVGVRGSAEEEEVTGRGNEGSQDQSNLSKEGGSGAQGVAAGSEAYDVAAGLNASIASLIFIKPHKVGGENDADKCMYACMHTYIHTHGWSAYSSVAAIIR
jgi:hypothetical protein